LFHYNEKVLWPVVWLQICIQGIYTITMFGVWCLYSRM
jgi:hypothetical protein